MVAVVLSKLAPLTELYSRRINELGRRGHRLQLREGKAVLGSNPECRKQVIKLKVWSEKSFREVEIQVLPRKKVVGTQLSWAWYSE